MLSNFAKIQPGKNVLILGKLKVNCFGPHKKRFHYTLKIILLKSEKMNKILSLE